MMPTVPIHSLNLKSQIHLDISFKAKLLRTSIRQIFFCLQIANLWNNLPDCYGPFKKISKYKLKFKTKPWITSGLQKAISIKNKLLTKYIKMKDHEKKHELHNKYENHTNLLSTLIRQSKYKYFNKYFEDNQNNMKNTWKGRKNI